MAGGGVSDGLQLVLLCSCPLTVSQPFLPSSSNPGGCAPRAATLLAQPRASYVSLSGPFIPRQVGRLLDKTEMATSPPQEVIHISGEV